MAQFFNDDTSSAFGIKTMTYEQIAKDVLSPSDVLICSDMLQEVIEAS